MVCRCRTDTADQYRLFADIDVDFLHYLHHFNHYSGDQLPDDMIVIKMEYTSLKQFLTMNVLSVHASVRVSHILGSFDPDNIENLFHFFPVV